jgi:hypothetical protein
LRFCRGNMHFDEIPIFDCCFLGVKNMYHR